MPDKQNFFISPKATLIIGSLVIFLLIVLLIFPCWHYIPPEAITESQVHRLNTALNSYKAKFGHYPFENNTTQDEKDVIINDKQYDELIEILSCKDGPDKDTVSIGNSKNIMFLQVPDSFLKTGFYDSWGNKLVIILDANSNRKILLNGAEITEHTAVYSLGENQNDDQGEKDDICSWK